METVGKHRTSDVHFTDWNEVATGLSVHSKHQWKECYSLPDTVVELTFVFLRVTFRGSPFLRSSLVLTKDTDSTDSTRPLHYSKSDRRVSRVPVLSPSSSFTHGVLSTTSV